MFDFDSELAELRQRNAEAQAARRAEEQRRHGIFRALFENANMYFAKRGLQFRAEIHEKGVDIVSMKGAVLKVSMSSGGNFDVIGGVNDVNSEKYIKKRDVSEKEATHIIVKWTDVP